MRFHVLDYIFAAIVIGFSLYSFKRGFIKRKSTFLACMAAFALTTCLVRFVPDTIYIFSGNNKAVSFVLIFILLWIIIKFLLHYFSRKVSKTVVLGTADKVLGLLIGLVQSVMIVFAIGCLVFFFAKDYAMQSVIIQQFIHFV